MGRGQTDHRTLRILHRPFPPLPGADTYHLFHWPDKDLPIASPAHASGGQQNADDFFNQLVRSEHF